MKKVSIIVPFYFNEKNVSVTVPALLELQDELSSGYQLEFIFVDDGSRDNTYEELKAFYLKSSSRINVVKLARNFGSTNAVLAGIKYSSGDICVFTAADMQTPLSLISDMLKYYDKGIPVVYAHRTGRDESLFIRLTAKVYHWLISKALPGSPRGGFDSFLLDRSVTEDVVANVSSNDYLPSLIMWLGYPSVGIPYKRLERKIGHSRWSLSKKVAAFFDSFLGYSYLPIRFFILIGLITGLLGILYLIIIIISHFVYGNEQKGWTSLVSISLIMSSLNFIFLGVLGEYIWRILVSVQGRSNYIVENSLLADDKSDD